MKTIIEPELFLKILKRMTHQIIEQNDDLKNLVLVGIKRKGTPIALYVSQMIEELEGIKLPVEEIDINKHRDDDRKDTNIEINFKTDIHNKVVVLVDDVLFTGRSVRAAMDAVIDLGRPSKIELAIFIDRGHRELPIRPDIVGKNIPTSKSERVVCDFENKTVRIE